MWDHLNANDVERSDTDARRRSRGTDGGGCAQWETRTKGWSGSLARATSVFVLFSCVFFPLLMQRTVTFHGSSRVCYPPIMDNNHITGRYIKGLAYRSVGSHSGTFQESTHLRAPTRSLLYMYSMCHVGKRRFSSIAFLRRFLKKISRKKSEYFS